MYIVHRHTNAICQVFYFFSILTIYTKLMRIVEEESKSSSSSSIGNNSDDEDCEGDAQSPYRYDDQNNNKTRNGSLHDAFQALEESLPIRRGISTFYNGKSKSFTCLADVSPSSTPSIQDIAKPENAYTRKRRNLLATTILSSKNKKRAFQLSSINTGKISKKPKNLNKPLLSNTQNLSSMRSFSMYNLHQCRSRFGLNSTEIENC